MDRLLIASEFVRGKRKSMICIRPDRSARGPWPRWVYARAFGLISGQAVEQPFGPPGSGRVYRSVPCIPSVANQVGGRGLHGRELELVCVERLARAQHAPGDAGELVGERGGKTSLPISMPIEARGDVVVLYPWAASPVDAEQSRTAPLGKQPVHPISGHSCPGEILGSGAGAECPLRVYVSSPCARPGCGRGTLRGEVSGTMNLGTRPVVFSANLSSPLPARGTK